MCNYKTWFHKNDVGYVVQCTTCGRMQVAFNIIVINLTESDFTGFRQSISETFQLYKDTVNENVKCIMISTPFSGLSFFLTITELKEFAYVLEAADNEMKVYQFIEAFNKSSL